MGQIATVEDLMGMCVETLPEKVVELDNGMSVRIRALKGSDTSRIFSMTDLDDKVVAALSKGVVEPVLRGNKLQKFIDYAPDASMTIFTEILQLSNAINEQTKEVQKKTEKKS